MKLMSSMSQPRSSATTWAIVVSRLCPWLAVPMISATSSVGLEAHGRALGAERAE